MRKIHKNKKGVLTFFLVFMILAIIIILISSVMAPLGSMVNTEFYSAGEDIMRSANDSVSKINNAETRALLEESYANALGGVQNNIEVNNAIFQYGWVIVLICVALFLFLFSRRIVEAGYFV